uniref:Uncharacterized protein n=1 Tax=Cucumis melo TaxID=3656 RepID=A0A9I9E8B0_CUCME
MVDGLSPLDILTIAFLMLTIYWTNCNNSNLIRIVNDKHVHIRLNKQMMKVGLVQMNEDQWKVILKGNDGKRS